MATNKIDFAVTAAISDEQKEILIRPKETSDGAPFYVCISDNEEISQLRQEETQWTQIWGGLSDEDVQSIGKAIAFSEENGVNG